jgi:Tetratricopeptide repeat
VQAEFNQAIAWLHSFEFEESERAFREVTSRDPHCAMAHWGIAMSLWHPLWEHPDAATIAQGWEEVQKAESLKAPTAREREYIAAIAAFYRDGDHLSHEKRAQAYSQAMEKVYQDNPQDREAAAFYALSLIASEPEPDPNWNQRRKAIAILKKLFQEEPNHPGAAHYLIHACDVPELAPEGLEAARRYAQIAPGSPHALHMPAHIFTRLGLWQQSIDSNLASKAAAEKPEAVHSGGGPGHALHALDFLEYAYLQTGRDADARHTIDEVAAVPGASGQEVAAHQAWFRARYALETHDWKQAAALEPSAGLRLGVRATVLWARTLGAARAGDPAAARQGLADLDAARSQMLAEPKRYGADPIEVERQEAAAWVEFAEGKKSDAVNTLRAAADREDAQGVETLGMPAREMLGDLLLATGDAAGALTAYRAALHEAPNRFDGLAGAAHAAEAAGQLDAARGYYSDLLKVAAQSNGERAEIQQARAFLDKKAS